MGRFHFALAFLGLFFSFIAQADRVWSRSIMAACDYVYQAESDVIVEAPAELFQVFAGAPLYLRARLANSWDRVPHESDTFIMAADDQGRASITFESMSVSNNFLFRDMTFDWIIKGSDGEWTSVSPASVSDIGRQFGEACFTERLSESQFVERVVTAN